ncbi:hypothetical protein KQI49_01760 [Virgibacillus sp. MSJ-26]|uniref:YqiA/YcfP family alpha/beta fold hydrolase n=1 Tax=Virgibacillus sp. MSJ-26 TaxID=2841522 RepID=UPI001C10B25E|nr:YqiA/YcfP family alpha/beta fold hydrolase [Virgibacillus sp. MSJ-26]MBU5465552.1 hypothetical protein [Virgibacillus sp. MSJ-26]
MASLTDQGASKIASETYVRNTENVRIELPDGEKVTYNVIETIEDKSTGLHGYVLENEITNEIVISFEGTQTKNGMTQSLNDIQEDINGIVFGDSSYTEVEGKSVKYRGSPSQDALLASGQAKIENGKFIRVNKNQFTEADPVVNKYIEEHGAENITFVGHSLGGALAEYFAVKYDSHAVSFAAPDIYNLLTKDQKQMVNNGDFKDNIISYAYPDDLVSWYDHNSIGSTYFLAHPGDAGNIKWFNNHGINNYTANKMFDKDGYFIPDLLFDETLFGHPEKSPLAMKNDGMENFNIAIKTFIMIAFSKQVENNANLVENTEKALGQFLEYYEGVMLEMKRKYYNLAGSEGYDLLGATDVDDILSEFGTIENGVPIIFNIHQYEEILKVIKELQTDTDEIAFHMNQMGDEFEETDILLAEWLAY